MTASLFFELVESRGGGNRRKTFHWETAGCEKEKCEKVYIRATSSISKRPLVVAFHRLIACLTTMWECAAREKGFM